MSDLWRHNCGALIDAQPGEVLACPGCGAYVTPAPERTPVEDVAMVCHAVALDRAKRWGYDETLDEADFWDLVKKYEQEDRLIRDVEVALAALDLPGRERALREEIEELAGELAEERTLHDATNAERDELRARIDAALSEVSNSEGAHHKQFAIDQMLRALTGCPMVERTAKDYRGEPYTYMTRGESEEYLEWVRRYQGDRDSEGYYEYTWDEGIAP